MRTPTLRRSLTVNAAALMTATVGANLLGFLFWGLAAHLKAPNAVGQASATIAALTLLATISQLSLTNVFIRLIPAAGRLGIRLIRRGYLAVIAAALLFGSLYVVSGLGHRVVSGWIAGTLFAAAIVVVAIFALQDSVLTALRLAVWVPIENISFGAFKLALLPALVALPSGSGIVMAWVLGAAVAVIAVNMVLFRRVLPGLRGTDGTLPPRRRLFSFMASEYAASICTTATVQLMPLIVLWRLGSAQTAYFTLPWLISMAITVLMWNIGGSLMVEAVGKREPTEALLRRSMIMWALLVAAVLLICGVGANALLGLAGARYAAGGVELLRLLAASAPFTAIVALYCTLAWLDQRVWLVAGFQAIVGATLVGGTFLLLPALGLVAVGWVNLATQAVAAAALGPIALYRLRRGVPVLEGP